MKDIRNKELEKLLGNADTEDIQLIRRKDIITEFMNKGYEAEEYTVIKNGVRAAGIRFKSESCISPVIYTQSIINVSRSAAEAADRVLNTYKNIDAFGFDIRDMKNPDFILKNLYIGLQKTSDEDVVKAETDLEGIEKYLYVRIDDSHFFILKKIFMEKILNIPEVEVWNTAERNTFAETEIVSMAEILPEMAGEEIDDQIIVPALYIVTNRGRFCGASAVLDRSALKNLAGKCNAKRFIVFPSSIHEMIAIPDDGNSDIEKCSEIVREINQTHVEPEERLTDRAYIIEVRNSGFCRR